MKGNQPSVTNATSQASESAETAPVTVLLTTAQIAKLDNIAVAIRQNTGKAMSRSAMMRAFFAALEPLYREWLKAGSEAALSQIITRRLNAANQQLVQQRALPPR